MAFAEVRLELGYDFGATGGPEYDTIIETTASGREYRSRRWSESRGSWDVGSRDYVRSKFDYLQAFFRARGGRADGFRFKDWGDYQATAQAVTLDGSPTAQLVKRYQDTAGFYDRAIAKPVAGSISFTRAGAGYATPTVDTTTGIVTWAADLSQTPSTVTVGTTTVCTVPDASLWTVGQLAWVSAPGQTAQLATVQAIDTTANTITLQLDSSTWTWTSGGTVARYPQPSETIEWSGEFDVPVRFDTDQFKAQYIGQSQETPPRDVFALQALPVVEIRL